jgi:hypothetical protein
MEMGAKAMPARLAQLLINKNRFENTFISFIIEIL